MLIHFYHLENEQLQDDTPRITSQVKSNYCDIIGFISFWILINTVPKEYNYTSSRLHIILEDSNMLHELFFVSKAP